MKPKVEAYVRNGYWCIAVDGARLDWSGKPWQGGPWAQFARESHAWEWASAMGVVQCVSQLSL